MQGTSEWECKLQAIEGFRQVAESAAREEFASMMMDACSVAVTFNALSPRARDMQIIPNPEEAFAMRMVWSYFCNTTLTEWEDFVATVRLPSIKVKKVVSWILADSKQNSNVIICVDELMLITDGNPSQDLTQEVSNLMFCLGKIIDKEPRVHIVLSSVQCNPLKNISTVSKRGFESLSLPPISSTKSVEIFRILKSNWFKPSEIGGNMGGTVKDVVQQAIIDCGGAPRLLENLYSILTEEEELIGKRTLTYVQERMWKFSVAKNLERAPQGYLRDALIMVCSGIQYSYDVLDKYSGYGMVLLSSGMKQENFAYMPPMLVGMLAVQYQKKKDFYSLEHKILDTCYDLMSLQTLILDPSASADYFEKTAAQLLRLRLLYLHGIGKKQFTLKDLLCADCHLENQDLWWKYNEEELQFDMPIDPLFPVLTRSGEFISRSVQQNSSKQGAIYIAKERQNPGYDIVIHLPGNNPSIAVQVKFSKAGSSTMLSNDDISESTRQFAGKHPKLARKTAAFVMFAFRRMNQNVESRAYVNSPLGVVYDSCKEIAVLSRQDILRLVPYSMRPRLLL
jgi:hypothetical protein